MTFIRNHDLAVISTVNLDEKPEAAVVEFGETKNLELIFDTFNTSRKYNNLQSNPHLAAVIGWDENITVQYEEKGVELIGKEKKSYQNIYFQKNKRAKRWQVKKGITYFKVTPIWIRYSDSNKDPMGYFRNKLLNHPQHPPRHR